MFFPPHTPTLRTRCYSGILPTRLILPALTLFQLTVNLALVFCLNHSNIFTREESHSSFVDVLYFEHRLQASEYATNIAAYLVYWLGFHLTIGPDLFYGRFVKAIIMAAIAPLTYCLLRRHHTWQFSLLTAAALGLMPGIYLYSALGIDIGLELPFGLLALLLATYSQPISSIAAGATLAFSCLCYGAGLAFVVPVAWLLSRHPNPTRRLLLAATAFLSQFLLAILYWTNVQMLLLGGGEPTLSWQSSLTSIAGSLLKGEPSYYYSLAGHPALGPFPIPWLSAAALVFACYRWRQHTVWLLLAAASLILGTFSGFPPGVRRVIPFVAATTILTSLLLQSLLARWPRLHLAIGLATTLLLGYDLARVARAWASWKVFIPIDFLYIEPSTLTTSPIPYPRVQAAIFHMLSRPLTTLSFEQVEATPDPNDPPFPANATRFSLTQSILEKRKAKATSAAK